jgi:signal transduction histidine kinase
MRAHAHTAALLLGPTRHASLTRRVRYLSDTRATATDTQAAELRRIERDLHDGAQARLVALGMTLRTAERFMDGDPGRARTLITEAREASAAALDELRNLVRGIFPPVLAERGLGDAVRALALDVPLPVEVRVELPRRVPSAIESCAYFAISEAVANVVKHAQATRAWLTLTHQDNVVRVSLIDNGRGGASFESGTGLHGVKDRLSTFDGTFGLRSPAGGPTEIIMEIPCELS